MARKGNGSFWWGMLVGAATGAATALLTSPKKGSEMRDDIVGKAQDVGRKAGSAWGGVKDKASSMVGSAKESASQAAERGREMAGTARARAQEAARAGREAAESKRQELRSEMEATEKKNM